MSDIDTVIAKVVEDIWGTYDKDNSGALDKEETKQFVKDTLKEMADGDDQDEFNEEDFNKCFEEFDKDGSGTIEKDEMALFIKKVAGLWVKIDMYIKEHVITSAYDLNLNW